MRGPGLALTTVLGRSQVSVLTNYPAPLLKYSWNRKSQEDHGIFAGIGIDSIPAPLLANRREEWATRKYMYGTRHRVHRGRDDLGKVYSICPLCWSIHCNLYVKVNRVKGAGQWACTPTHTSLGSFFHRNGMYARKRPLPLCVYSVVHAQISEAPRWLKISLAPSRGYISRRCTQIAQGVLLKPSTEYLIQAFTYLLFPPANSSPSKKEIPVNSVFIQESLAAPTQNLLNSKNTLKFSCRVVE